MLFLATHYRAHTWIELLRSFFTNHFQWRETRANDLWKYWLFSSIGVVQLQCVRISRNIAMRAACRSAWVQLKCGRLPQNTGDFHKIRGTSTKYGGLPQNTGDFHKIRGTSTKYGRLGRSGMLFLIPQPQFVWRNGSVSPEKQWFCYFFILLI